MMDFDIDMFFDKEKDEYYCLRCQYTGKEADILKDNEQVRTKYKAMYQRYSEFDFE